MRLTVPVVEQNGAQRLVLASLLRGLRVEAGLRQEDVAARLRTTQSFVSKYESGERRLDVIELRHICAALGIPMRRVVKLWEHQLEDG